MKRAILVIAAVILAALLAPALSQRQGTAAVAATPTPAALQYDEITRMILPPATPPAPGSFHADYVALVGTPGAQGGAASPAPKKHGLGSILSSVMSGQPPDSQNGAAENPAEMMRGISAGNLARQTFYKGWLRTDYPVLQTATISKCEQHQFIALNLAKKTYAISNTKPACPTPAMPMGMQRRAPESAPAGTADMTVKGTAQNLGPLDIDGVATTGADHSMEMSVTNATGSCHDSDMKMSMMQYVSTIGVPRAYCPLPHAGGPSEMMSARGGCVPTMHVQTQGLSFGEVVGGRLVMYSRMSLGSAGGATIVTERGNVKWLSGSAADALFAVPADFTQGQ